MTPSRGLSILDFGFRFNPWSEREVLRQTGWVVGECAGPR